MKLKYSGLCTTTALLFMAVIQTSHAVEDIDFSGYFTMKGTYADIEPASGSTSTSVGYRRGYADDRVNWDTNQTRIGLQATAQVSPKLDMTLVMQGNGGSNDKYQMNATWAYAGYALTDNFTLRLGKVKGPFYMVSDYVEVGYAYPWATPPMEVYSTNPMKSLTGLDLVYSTDLAGMNFLFEIYTGSGAHTATLLPNFANSDTTDAFDLGEQVTFTTHNMVGFNTSLSAEGISFRLGYFTTKVVVPAFGITTNDGTNGAFGGAGLIVDWRDLVIYSEYIVRDTDPALAGAFPDQHAYYLTMGYRFSNFLPYVTYANMDKGKDDSAYAMIQSSVAIGLRYEVGDTSTVKFEILQATADEDSGDLGKYGLFDEEVNNDEGTIITLSYDLIF